MTRSGLLQEGGSQTSPEDRRGFALATVLVLMVVLSSLTVFLLSSSGDMQRAGRAIRESARSFYAADAGVNAVLADWDSLRYDTLAPDPGDSADLGWTSLENGARYRPVLVRVDGGAAASVVHSVRILGQGKGAFGGSTTMFRDIVTPIPFEGGRAAIEGGIAARNLEFLAGGSTVSGLDTIPSDWASEGICDPVEDMPGAIWTDTTRITGETATSLKGNPASQEDATSTLPQLMDFGGVDYNDLVDMADITISNATWSPTIAPAVSGGSCDTSVTTNWGAPTDPSSPCFDYFPIIHLTSIPNARFRGSGSGQGIILFDNLNLTFEMLSGPFTFFGLIIAQTPGGGLQFTDTDFNLYGAMISADDVELDGGHVRYSQCAVERALAGQGMGERIQSMSERMWRQATN